MKYIPINILLTTIVVAMIMTGCSKQEVDNNGGNTATGNMVSVTLPIGLAETEAATAPTPTHSRGAAVAEESPADGFTVSFGGQLPQAATHAPATRSVAQELTNVWVLQFDKDGKNVSTSNKGTLAAGAYLTAPSLQVGTGYTIYVIANGTASGLSITNPATLAAFESKMLHIEDVTDDTKLPMSGKLVGVSVVDLGDGKGTLKLMDSSSAVILRRIHAEVALSVDFDVTGYTLTDAQLYNIPLGATYGWNNNTTTFPDNSGEANFNYTDPTIEGMESLAPTTSGSKTTYKWFVGDNRRGDVVGLIAQADRYKAKAPAYATFARVTLTNNTLSAKKLYYDIYLGSGLARNFDLVRNHTYTATAAIKGTAEFQEMLIGTDARVSGEGHPIYIYLTDNSTDSPLIILPKSTESTVRVIWGPTNSILMAQDIYDGKRNTDAIMATSGTDYLAAKHCRAQGASYYLPSQAELMLMWIYETAIPAADRLASDYFWSSTQNSTGTTSALYVHHLNGNTSIVNKGNSNYVRCVRER